MSVNNRVTSCKICKNNQFTSIIDLGKQSYTGIFVKPGEEVNKVPLELVSCNSCGLVQIGHDFELEIMYGDGYGYRSSQNNWMIQHLQSAVAEMSKDLQANDLVVEIGSNDATSLSFFPNECRRIGVDPSAESLRNFYPDNTDLIVDFFSDSIVKKILTEQGKAKLIMSFAMFYDLPDPIEFAKNVSTLLSEDGLWVFEQSYLLSMLNSGAFDTICHEHLEYYTLYDIERILSAADMKVVDVSLNDSNGGSFRITATHNINNSKSISERVFQIRENEQNNYNENLVHDFLDKVKKCRDNILNLLLQCKEEGLNLYGIGASTKGNVLLQYCNLSNQDIVAIGEINSDKIGKVCPGSNIPIVSEDEVLSDENGIYLILPWHFKDFFINSEKFKGKKVVFPLPNWEIL
jgi:NDP-4-keto-2,6-dideoxyhexose 3-C-methyltransferase